MSKEYKKLQDLCISVTDCPHSTPQWTKDGFLVIRNYNIKNGRLDLSKPSYTNKVDFAKRIQRAVPEAGDIIITREAPMGEVCRIPNGLECCLGQRMVLLKPNYSLVDGDYLLYALMSKEVQTQILYNEGTGSTVSNLRIPLLCNLPIPYVDRTQQRKISGILANIDHKIALNTAINDNLQQQADAIFDENFPLQEPLPVGWRKSHLSSIAKYLNGLAMQKYRPAQGENGLPVLKIKELRQGMTDDNSDRCSANIKPEYIVHDGDIIFSWSGSLLVDFWCGGDCGLNQHLFKVTSTQFDKWFVYAWTKHYLNHFIAVAADKATTMGHIKRDELDKAEVIIPSSGDYMEIGALMQPLYDEIISNRIESRKLSELRDALLPRLMSGELDVSVLDL